MDHVADAAGLRLVGRQVEDCLDLAAHVERAAGRRVGLERPRVDDEGQVVDERPVVRALGAQVVRLALQRVASRVLGLGTICRRG